jgi:iron complex outermembrane receptor protein
MKSMKRRGYRRYYPILAAVGCVLAFETPAAELETVVVTARKREEDTQNVATSIRVLSGEEAVTLGVQRPADLAALTPGLNAKYTVGSESPVFTMRGIGLNDFSSINNPSVGVYFDDIFVPFIPMMGGQIYDIERIEVLKGPQGTLYGRNTTGGAIKFISRKPTSTTQANLRADYSSWRTLEVEAGIGGALTDTLNARVAAFTRQRGSGYMYNRYSGKHVGEQDRLAGRVILDWRPSDTFDAELNLHAGRDRSDAILREHIGFRDPVTGVITCPAVLAGKRGGCTDLSGYADNDNNPYASDVNNLYGDKVRSRTYGAALSLNWDLSRATLTSVSGYDRYARDLVDDTDASPNITFETDVHEKIYVFSQEIRLVSDDSWKAKWVAGLFYSRDNTDTSNEQAVDELYRTRVKVLNDQTTEAYALFANGELPLAERWSLTAGIRLSHEKKRRWTQSLDLASLGNISMLSPTGGYYVFVTDDTTIEDDDVSGNLGLNYRPSDDVMLYATASRGFKSGGFKGNISFNPLQVGAYDPEALFAYEAGIKSTLLDGSLRFNAAAYYYDWKDFQAYSLVQLEIPVVMLTNAGDAEVKGIEADITWRPIDRLQVSAAANWMEGKIVKFDTLPGGQDNRGKKLANAPEVTFSGVVKYEFPSLGRGWSPYVQSQVSYQSRVFFEIQNNPINSQGEYWLASLRLGATSEDGKWDIALWSRNLFNEAYISESRFVDLRVFPSQNTYGEPRSVGIGFTYQY